MKLRRIKMTLDEYHRLPSKLAWKQEYIDGYLVETPREIVVHATIPVAPRATQPPAPLRAVTDADERELQPCFRAAFANTFEFCGYPKKRFADAVRQCLQHFFHGPFHHKLRVSRVAVGPAGSSDAGKPIGAALLLAQDAGWALLDMIFVAPAWQRRGVATALASAALNGLAELGGYTALVSRYQLGNEASRAWHHRFGFVDEPDLRIAQLHLRAATHELNRRRESERLPPSLERQLTERDLWQGEVERLEALVRQGREEEADPWRRWRRKTLENEAAFASTSPPANPEVQSCS